MDEREGMDMASAVTCLRRARGFMREAVEHLKAVEGTKDDREAIASIHMQLSKVEYGLEQRALGREWDP